MTWIETGLPTVFNLATQEHWRTGARLDYIHLSVCAMLGDAKLLGVDQILLPQIGAGLGGLPWEAVRKILLNISDTSEVELLVVERFVPGTQPK